MSRLRLFLLLAALLPSAGAFAAAEGDCVSAKVERAAARGGVFELYRIVFQNRCERPRNLYWCAEADKGPLPPGLACVRAQATVGPIAESRHAIRLRKEFQWHLPAGTRIRYHDCPLGEMPTTDFGCAPPPPPTPARR